MNFKFLLYCCFYPRLLVVISLEEDFLELEERRKIFSEQAENTWFDVDRLVPGDIPAGFDMDILTLFLSLSDVLINGKKYSFEVNKPTKMGRNMYVSKNIKRAWFCQTTDCLLFRCNMAASMSADKR